MLINYLMVVINSRLYMFDITSSNTVYTYYKNNIIVSIVIRIIVRFEHTGILGNLIFNKLWQFILHNVIFILNDLSNKKICFYEELVYLNFSVEDMRLVSWISFNYVSWGIVSILRSKLNVKKSIFDIDGKVYILQPNVYFYYQLVWLVLVV